MENLPGNSVDNCSKNMSKSKESNLSSSKLRCLFVTPQQYNKKTVKIGQGLDFLKFRRGKSKKTTGKMSENQGKTITSRNFMALCSYEKLYYSFFCLDSDF